MAVKAVHVSKDFGALAFLRNVVIEPVAANPTVDCNGDPLDGDNAGLFIYNTTDGVLRYWDGTQWVDLLSSVAEYKCQELTQSLVGGAVATTLTFTDLADICQFQARDSAGNHIEVCWQITGTNTVDVESTCDLTNAVFAADGPCA